MDPDMRTPAVSASPAPTGLVVGMPERLWSLLEGFRWANSNLTGRLELLPTEVFRPG